MVSRSRTGTQTSSYSRVLHVTRRLQADLFNLVDTYGQISESYAKDLIHDFRVLLDEDVLEMIRLLWKQHNSSKVIFGYSYTVLDGVSGLVDERSGGIRYRSQLLDHKFSVRIFYNDRWNELSESSRSEIRSQCRLTWSKGTPLNYPTGSGSDSRTFAKDNYGLRRNSYGG